jgi:DNA-binding response OmpR family regulator
MNELPERDKSVLIVDDEPRIGRILAMKLKLAHYEPVVATSGLEAIRLMETRNPDIMLLDIVMPDMDGCQVLERIRRFAKIPVIVMTALPEAIDRAMRLGATDSIIKPFDPDRLVGRITELLRGETATKPELHCGEATTSFDDSGLP